MAINTIQNGAGPLGVNGAGGRAGQKSPEASRKSVSESGAGERLELSGGSQQLEGMRTGLGNDAPVDAARVETLRAAIADGSYQVNAERLAARLFGFESSL